MLSDVLRASLLLEGAQVRHFVLVRVVFRWMWV